MSNSILIEKKLDPEARAHRIKYIREHLLHFSRPELCVDSEISPHALKAWEMGIGGGLTEKGALKLVNQLKKFHIRCSVAWLLYGIGAEPVQGGSHSQTFETEEDQIAKELLVFQEQKNAVYTIVQDDSMIPLLYPGDYVAGVLANKISEIINKESIIQTAEKIYVRKILQGQHPDRFDLIAINQSCVMAKPVLTDITVQYAASILWIRRKNTRES